MNSSAGGQSSVDSAALDAAIELGIPQMIVNMENNPSHKEVADWIKK
jgi:hypothetical protein